MILNLFVDYFLLLSCGMLLKVNFKKARIILGAILGSLFSLLILLPSLNFFLNFIIKSLSGLILVLAAFGFKGKQIFIKTVLIFFAENLIFVGVMFFVWVFFSPPGMFWKNGVTYIAISPFILLIGSLVSYVATCFFNFALSKRVDCRKIVLVEIEFNGKKEVLNALYDSGNCLLEPFSKKPVCVCEFERISKIFPEELKKFFCDFFQNAYELGDSNFKKSIKLIPCDTISGSLILPAFLPNSFFIFGEGGEKKCFDCFVAVTTKKMSDGEYGAIIGDF